MSVIVVGYESRNDLTECLSSVLDQQFGGELETIFVDNASSDGSAAFVQQMFPEVTVIQTGTNLGYAGGVNVGFRHATGNYLIALNPDTVVAQGFVGALVNTSALHADRVLVTSCVLFYDDRETINALGNDVNFGLIAACRAIGEPRARHTTEIAPPSISGCAFLIPRSILADIGPFEAALHLYLEDTDLSLRALLAGYRCVTSPESVVYHKYQLKMDPAKLYYIERNRWVLLLSAYRWRTILALLPGLLAIEALAWTGAAKLGRDHIRAKARSYLGIVRMAPTIRQTRQRIQGVRRVTDREVLDQIQGPLPLGRLMPEGRLAQTMLKLINLGLAGYFGAVRRLIRW